MARYCSTQCQSSHWVSAHKVACQELKEDRKLSHAQQKAEGRPQKNRYLIIDWFKQIPNLNFDVALLAWKHRNDEEPLRILVQTSKQTLSSGAPDGTPQLTAVTLRQWKDILGQSEFERDDFDANKTYIICFDLDHTGSETWPRHRSLIMQHHLDPVRMDFELLLKECTEAKSFPEKVAAESAFQVLKLSHPLLVSEFMLPEKKTVRLHFGHRISAGILGCIRGLCGASHLNDKLGLFISKDPNNPMRSAVELADGQVRSVADTNFELLKLGTSRVVLHGLTGAAHLNGKYGTLIQLKSGSLERVVVRLDAGGEEMAVKFANYNTCVDVQK
jgi:hypothetical protein